MTEREHTGRVEYRAERRYDLPASAEQIWDVIATAEGISSWMVPTRLDPQVGGEVTFNVDGFTSTGVVTDYTPIRRFAYEEPWPIASRAEDIPREMIDWFDSKGVSLSEVYDGLSRTTPVATEFLIEAASGGSCIVRIVTSAYGSGADWENEFFAEMVSSTIPIWDRLPARFTKAVTR